MSVCWCASPACGAAADLRASPVDAPQVMHNKQNKQMLTLVGGFAVLLLLLYYLTFK
jgi:hypothetical protein